METGNKYHRLSLFLSFLLHIYIVLQSSTSIFLFLVFGWWSLSHIDATSCQAERNFSALSALLGDLQSNLGRRKVEMMMLLKLNQQLIQGLADVLQQVADLKDATAAGNVVSLS